METYVHIYLVTKIPIQTIENRYISISNLYKENAKKKKSCVSQIKVAYFLTFEVFHHHFQKKELEFTIYVILSSSNRHNNMESSLG
jgi:hypothetical protein